jgi:hypothetical protein
MSEKLSSALSLGSEEEEVDLLEGEEKGNAI